VSRKGGGTGLGTKIIKEAIDAHGGRISVQSEPGRGTTFEIRLPIDARDLLKSRD
jgi:signal transduction histidine kinase